MLGEASVRRSSPSLIIGFPRTISRGAWHAYTFLIAARRTRQEMSDWHDFFVAQVGAYGVLTGLVLVGVSINMERIMST
jgi:hypothetical protein